VIGVFVSVMAAQIRAAALAQIFMALLIAVAVTLAVSQLAGRFEASVALVTVPVGASALVSPEAVTVATSAVAAIVSFPIAAPVLGV
jgi:hypothetical protein